MDGTLKHIDHERRWHADAQLPHSAWSGHADLLLAEATEDDGQTLVALYAELDGWTLLIGRELALVPRASAIDLSQDADLTRLIQLHGQASDVAHRLASPETAPKLERRWYR